MDVQVPKKTDIHSAVYNFIWFMKNPGNRIMNIYKF